MIKIDLLQRTVFLTAMCAALVLIAFVNNAVPGMTLPTLGQALWTTGFGTSYANQAIPGIFAHDIGYPTPAAISFGLAGAWPVGIMIKLGLSAPVAYSTMVACWLGVAFIGSYGLCRRLGNAQWPALAAATAWTTLPVISQHAGYSMLGLGIALLPTYMFSSIGLAQGNGAGTMVKAATLHVLVCVISVFMDGYTFVMLGLGGGTITIFSALARGRSSQAWHGWYAVLVHAFGLTLAYSLYRAFVGPSVLPPAPIDFFRAWGMDLAYAAIPTRGLQWFPDLIGFSEARTLSSQFGDASVWATTFCMPLLAACLLTMFFTRIQRPWLYAALLLTAAFSFYMSLGPSIKLHSGNFHNEASTMMPATRAIAPTGSALLSEHAPGFKEMRASYRWIALSMCCCWILLALLMPSWRSRTPAWPALAVWAAIILLSLPHPRENLQRGMDYLSAFHDIQKQLEYPLSEDIPRGSVVAFLPYRNDFMATYLAPSLGLRTYSIGGDKNLAAARRHWPDSIRQLEMGQADVVAARAGLSLLIHRQADAIVIPYYEGLFDAHQWPPSFLRQTEVRELEEELKNSGLVSMKRRELYAVATLNNRARERMASGSLEADVATYFDRGFCLEEDSFDSQTHHQIGTLEQKTLSSGGQAGFLLFGPYRPVPAGHYAFALYGQTGETPSAWMDIGANAGNTQYIHAPLRPNRSGVLAEGEIVLPGDVKDLEIRVSVGTGDDVNLTGYRLEQQNAGRSGCKAEPQQPVTQ